MKTNGFIENIKQFIVSKPPVALFTLAIVIVALGSVAFSFYIKNANLIVGDVKTDWDIFVEKLPSLTFCLDSGSKGLGMESPYKPGNASNSSAMEETRNISFPVSLTLKRVGQLSSNASFIHSALDSNKFGFKDFKGRDILMEIFVTVPNVNNNNGSHGNSNGNNNSLTMKIESCATVVAPKSILSSSTANPTTCIHSTDNNNNSTSSGSFNVVPFVISSETKWINCSWQTEASLKLHVSPSRVVYLSAGEKSAINLHLFYTSVFLFVMMFMVLAFAALKGRRHPKLTHESRQNKTSGSDSKVLMDIPLLSEEEF